MVDPNLMLALDTYALCRTSMNNREFDRLSVKIVFNDGHVSLFLFGGGGGGGGCLFFFLSSH